MFIFRSEIGGHVLIPVFGTCQSNEQVADGEWADAKKIKAQRSILGSWARKGVTADGA